MYYAFYYSQSSNLFSLCQMLRWTSDHFYHPTSLPSSSVILLSLSSSTFFFTSNLSHTHMLLNLSLSLHHIWWWLTGVLKAAAKGSSCKEKQVRMSCIPPDLGCVCWENDISVCISGCSSCVYVFSSQFVCLSFVISDSLVTLSRNGCNLGQQFLNDYMFGLCEGVFMKCPVV